MFTVPARGDREDSFTFRPELTPGTLRALIQNGLFKQRPFWKLYYIGAQFRYERPQKGRLRQFHQFGVEAVGSKDPLLDVETMAVYADILRAVGVDYDLYVNTLGCPACRPAYREKVKAAIQADLDKYCADCKRRYERNVFRVFDCKVETCAALAEALPAMVDHVCAECMDHFTRVRNALPPPWQLNKRIVRGLDYYTRTVYEFKSKRLGAQDALGGGGRYDTLVASMGGPDVGAVGFAAGMERILIAAGDAAAAPAAQPDFFVVAAGDEARAAVFKAAQELRAAGLAGDVDYEARSVKAQMRRANDLGARFVVIIGGQELAQSAVKVKNMEDGTERTVPLLEARDVIGRKR